MSSAAWKQQGERSNRFFIWLLVTLARLVGRRLITPLLWAIALFYVVTNRPAVKAVGFYWRRLGYAPTFWRCWGHFYCFARVSVDRLYVLLGQLHLFDVKLMSTLDLDAIVTTKQGAFVFVSHVGGFDILRALAAQRQLPPIKILMDSRHNSRVIESLRALNPRMALDIIDVDIEGFSLMVKLADLIAQGYWIGVMVDRLNGQENSTHIDFLGGQVRVPLTPWQMASILEVPVYSCTALFAGGNSYQVYLTQIAQNLSCARKERQQFLTAACQSYFVMLEQQLKLLPNNWFNFFDYWLHDST